MLRRVNNHPFTIWILTSKTHLLTAACDSVPAKKTWRWKSSPSHPLQLLPLDPPTAQLTPKLLVLSSMSQKRPERGIPAPSPNLSAYFPLEPAENLGPENEPPRSKIESRLPLIQAGGPLTPTELRLPSGPVNSRQMHAIITSRSRTSLQRCRPLGIKASSEQTSSASQPAPTKRLVGGIVRRCFVQEGVGPRLALPEGDGRNRLVDAGLWCCRRRAECKGCSKRETSELRFLGRSDSVGLSAGFWNVSDYPFFFLEYEIALDQLTPLRGAYCTPSILHMFEQKAGLNTRFVRISIK